MNLKDELRSVLEASGYRTAVVSTTTDTIHFEDHAIAGAIFLYSSVEMLLENWEKLQDRFLGTNSSAIRSDPIKAWNIYTVHVTPAIGNSGQMSEAFNIEQNFRGTRKIVRTGVVTRPDIIDAVLPLLPLQHRTVISTQDFMARYKERLSLTSESLSRIVDQPNATNIDQQLLEES